MGKDHGGVAGFRFEGSDEFRVGSRVAISRFPVSSVLEFLFICY
jgi:hypothetical protein